MNIRFIFAAQIYTRAIPLSYIIISYLSFISHQVISCTYANFIFFQDSIQKTQTNQLLRTYLIQSSYLRHRQLNILDLSLVAYPVKSSHKYLHLTTSWFIYLTSHCQYITKFFPRHIHCRFCTYLSSFIRYFK